MTKTFTHDDLIRYYYKETSRKESIEIEKALLCDSELMEEYKQISAMMKKLEKVKKEPSDKVVANILDYSKSYSSQPIKD